MIERWLGPPWIWLGLYGIVLGFSLWFSAPARPDPVGVPGQGDWAAVCDTLDALPTPGGVNGVILAVAAASGLGPDAAARVVAAAVHEHCPYHERLLAAFEYGVQAA